MKKYNGTFVNDELLLNFCKNVRHDIGRNPTYIKSRRMYVSNVQIVFSENVWKELKKL